MTVVYADSVFLLNGAMDYVLLLVTARLAGIPLKRRRYLLAAALGAVYAVAVFLPGMGFLSAFASKLAVGVLLASLSAGRKSCCAWCCCCSPYPAPWRAACWRWGYWRAAGSR